MRTALHTTSQHPIARSLLLVTLTAAGTVSRNNVFVSCFVTSHAGAAFCPLTRRNTSCMRSLKSNHAVFGNPFMADGRQTNSWSVHQRYNRHVSSSRLYAKTDMNDEDDDDEEDEDEDLKTDLYKDEFAPSEFSPDTSVSNVDWGGALGTLRERVGDINAGKTGPSNALFRVMTGEGPNETIMKFVQEAKPDIVNAMSGAVGSLLGGLSSPAMGVETIIKSDGEKLGNLCFQLQMTGYMFRNAEYVLALKDMMNLQTTAEISQYKAAFQKLDKDNSGYIEAAEVEALLADVYEGAPPKFEVEAFLGFFDSNQDGKVSWEEFERGLGHAAQSKQRMDSALGSIGALPGGVSNELDDDDDDDAFVDAMGAGAAADISGVIEVELESGKIIQVEAKDYIEGLKAEAQALKEALREEQRLDAGGELPPSPSSSGVPSPLGQASSKQPMDPRPQSSSSGGGIAQYISTLGEKNVKKLTEGISSEVLDAMKLLVDYVLDRGRTKSGKKVKAGREDEIELAGSALQQLALWQLVLGYRLREQEATGEWRRMLED